MAGWVVAPAAVRRKRIARTAFGAPEESSRCNGIGRTSFRNSSSAVARALGAIGSVFAGLRAQVIRSLVLGLALCACGTPGSSDTDPHKETSWQVLLFVTEDCPPCTSLRETTLTDPGVASILRQIDLQVVSEQDKSASAVLTEYATTYYPRMVFIRDGMPEDWIAGAVAPVDFISEWDRIRQGGSGTVSSYRTYVRQSPKEPIGYHELGVKLLLLGQMDEALEQWKVLCTLEHGDARRMAESLLMQIRSAQLFLIQEHLEREPANRSNDDLLLLSAFVEQKDVPPDVRSKGARFLLAQMRRSPDKPHPPQGGAMTPATSIAALRVAWGDHGDPVSKEWWSFAKDSVQQLWEQQEPLTTWQVELAETAAAVLRAIPYAQRAQGEELLVKLLWLAGDHSSAERLARERAERMGDDSLLRALRSR
jgi:hypothetical protein